MTYNNCSSLSSIDFTEYERTGQFILHYCANNSMVTLGKSYDDFFQLRSLTFVAESDIVSTF